LLIPVLANLRFGFAHGAVQSPHKRGREAIIENSDAPHSLDA
jgi:hypothetical protein